jgi:hypothetical protein
LLTAKLGQQHATFGLAQDRKDLGFGISRLLHLNPLVHLAERILLLSLLTYGGITPELKAFSSWQIARDGISTWFQQAMDGLKKGTRPNRAQKPRDQ